MVVFSDPPGADIILDDFHTNRKTPVVLKNIKIGQRHSIILKMKGYGQSYVDFEIDDSAKKLVDVTLTKP